MSTSAYYNFMTTGAGGNRAAHRPQQTTGGASVIMSSGGMMTEARARPKSRLPIVSSSSFQSSPSFSSSSNTTSSSSLNQFYLHGRLPVGASKRSDSSSSSSVASSTSTSTSTSNSISNSSNRECNTITTTNNTPTESNYNERNNNHQEQPDLQSSVKSSVMNRHQLPTGHDDDDNKTTPPPESITAAPSIIHHHAQPQHHHQNQMFHSYTLHSLEPKPFKPFKTKSDYIEAMKEDLAEWLNQLYPDLDLTTGNFFSQLETGAIICRHANKVTLMGRNLIQQQQQQHQSLDSSPDPHNSLNESIRANSNSPMSSASSNDFSLGYSSTSSTSKSITNHPQRLMSPRQSISSLSRAATDINWFRVKMIPYKEQAKAGTFFARDNICQFILWCRSLDILECLLFETDDLVARKNEKSFILCLLEVARIGFKVGMPTPLIIQLEQEIDREIEEEAKLEAEKQLNQIPTEITTTSCHPDGEESCSDFDESSSRKTSDDEGQQQLGIEKKLETSRLDDEQAKQSEEEQEDVEEREEEEDYGPKPQVITNDLVSLHEKVVQLLCQCTCPTQFPMVRVGDNGKYKIGDKLIIFVRILRRHIMVRVGGGWQELSEFLRAKDPCRSKLSFNHHSNHHHSAVSMSPLGSHHHHHNSAHNGPQSIRQTSFSSSSVSRSRLLDNGHLTGSGSSRPTAGYNGNSDLRRASTTRRANSPAATIANSTTSGHRFISGSASMSWISNNS